MKCRNCDSEIANNAPFCSQCGLRQEIESAAVSRTADKQSELYSGTQPRSFAGTVLQLLFIMGLPFGLLLGGAMSMMFGWPYGELLPLWIIVGIVFGLIMGLAMAPKFRGATVEVEFEDTNLFIDSVNIALAELAYSPAVQTRTLLQFKPTFRAGLAAGAITVSIREKSATIVGPKYYTDKIVRQIVM